jgi:hypothetical protein
MVTGIGNRSVCGVVDFVGCLTIMRLMNPAAIAEIEIASQPSLQVASVLVAAQVDVLVLHAAPEAFYEHVVDPAPFAAHAGANTRSR